MSNVFVYGLYAALWLLGAASPTGHQRMARPVVVVPTTDSQDVKSVDGIIAALYDVISGDSGVSRDWDRFRALFAPGARLIPVGQRQGGAVGALPAGDQFHSAVQ